jgi:pimeloyl-ACP methyl ester carboxylesterase
MATYLLVHGAFQGGWIWKDTARRLCALGHEAHAPTLSGCGYLADSGDQNADLNTYVRDIDNYIAFMDLDDFVLVAHSFSGMICAAVAMNNVDRVTKTIFVDAVIPESGQSFATMSGEKFQQMLSKHKENGGMIRPWPLEVFGVPELKSHWFKARMRGFPEAAFHTPLPANFDPHALNAAFIACTRTKNPFIRSMAEKASGFGWPVRSLESAHSPMSSHPEELAVLLHELSGNKRS